jgi:hypothetical protein
MLDEDLDQRHAAAYHVAVQAVMAFYLGGSVNDEGVEIDERRYCSLSLPFGHDAPTKERFAVSSWKLAIRGSTMGLHWYRGPKIVVEVSGSEILVTMPGTSLSVVYEKPTTISLLPTPSLRGRTRNASSAFRNFLPLHGSLLTRRQNRSAG